MASFYRLIPLLILLVLLGSCATYPPREGNVYALDALRAGGSSSPPAPASVVQERSGLGTSWGEDRHSPVRGTQFSRGGKSRPFGSGKVYYNDEVGAQAMAKRSGIRWTSRAPTTLASGTVSMGLKDGSGRFLKSYASGSQRFFVGEDGDRYQVYLKNLTDHRVEVVVSVDGLDVLDGKPASVKKRGYLLEPRGTLSIEGFRQSDSTVAAFRFGSVAESYAEKKHGDSRNVGVIGVAVWTEDGIDPFRPSIGDTWKRRTADPFPGTTRYATPPD